MSSTPHDESVKSRILKTLITLLEAPAFYTRKELAERLHISARNLSRDFEEISNAGFTIERDERNRYYLLPSKATEHIKELLLLSDYEINTIAKSLQSYTSQKEAERITHKIVTQVSLPRLSNVILNKPYLGKLQVLHQALKNKFKVKLISYRSTNSNATSDRVIEPFHIASDEDILHAYDYQSQAIRHFRITRIEQLEMLEDKWENQNKHVIINTDIFKIANHKQIKVHIRLKVGGYNKLVEQYPLSKAYLSPCPGKPGFYDLECVVNENLYGLKNFLLGYYEYVDEIIETAELRKEMNAIIKKIKF